jgi:1-phosphatidylinositol-3-phosphate 5-kinase
VAKLDCIEQIIKAQNVTMKPGLYNHVADLKVLVKVEWKKYDVSLNATCFIHCI